jgi:hypothetical protein
MDGQLVKDMMEMTLGILMLGALIFAIVWSIVAPFKFLRKKDTWDTSSAGQSVPPMFQKLLDKAMAERDAEHERVKERLATLERIVVDSHKRVDLSGTIERLQEK